MPKKKTAKKLSAGEKRRRESRQLAATRKASNIFLSGKAKQTVLDVSTPVLEQSLGDIRTFGNPKGKQIAGELARRAGGGKRGDTKVR